MGYRQVVIHESEKLSLEKNQLIIKKSDIEEYKVPLEDINYILVEDSKTIITSRLMSEVGKSGIAMIICDEKFIPTSILYPYNFHFKQLENVNNQIKLSQNYKDKLWSGIVKSKLNNSLKVIDMTTKDEFALSKITKYIGEIEIGDVTNREGLAAKIYFRSIYGSEFIRFYDDSINSALNYGYTIFASAIIRNLVLYGLNTYMGIHHDSKINNFNLAYDFLEPYRCVVDKFVYDNIDLLQNPLSFEFRKKLINLLNKEVIHHNKKYTIDYSIGLLVKSYINCITNEKFDLDLPEMIYE